MKQTYRLFQRASGVFYLENTESRQQESLRTKDKGEAHRIWHAKNEAHLQPAMNVQIARAYLSAGDPAISSRTWQFVMDEVGKVKKGVTQERWERAMRESPFDKIRTMTLFSTRAEHFLTVLHEGTTSTNIFLRRLHNFAVDMSWLAVPILPRKQWPKVQFDDKRAITFEEYQKILSIEENPERIKYYQMLWHLGGSQSDIASLCAEDVDFPNRIISFARMKRKTSVVQFHFGEQVKDLLKTLPPRGPLFPQIRDHKESDRAKQFWRACGRLNFKGISLHSFRYAWAERAKIAGYPERFAQEALGHNSKAIHRAYSRRAQVKIPSLEDFERKYGLFEKNPNTDRNSNSLQD